MTNLASKKGLRMVAQRTSGARPPASLLVRYCYASVFLPKAQDLAGALRGGVDMPAEPGWAPSITQPLKKDTMKVSKRKFWNAYAKMHTAWNSESIDERIRIAAEILDENIQYQTVRHDTVFGRGVHPISPDRSARLI